MVFAQKEIPEDTCNLLASIYERVKLALQRCYTHQDESVLKREACRNQAAKEQSDPLWSQSFSVPPPLCVCSYEAFFYLKTKGKQGGGELTNWFFTVCG